MHEEWATGTGELSSTSWNGRRLIGTAGFVAVALLVLGLGLGRLFTPNAVSADSGPVETEVAGVVESAPVPETEIADAVAAVREGPLAVAPTEHLTVVQISVSVCGARSTGSGVVVADGLLLTAAHVVGDADLVRIDQGGITVTGEVLGVLADGRDIALVAVDAPMTAPLEPVDVPSVGEAITLVGHADGGPRTILVGPRVDIAPVVATLAGGGDVVGVDASIRAGVSGGPAVDASGGLFGIVVAKEQATDTALVVATPDLRSLAGSALVPGTCIGSA